MKLLGIVLLSSCSSAAAVVRFLLSSCSFPGAVLLDEHHKDYHRCHTGLRNVPGLKRKTSKDDDDGEEVSGSQYMKRLKSDDSPKCSSKSHCEIERSLSQGFASLSSTGDKPCNAKHHPI